MNQGDDHTFRRARARTTVRGLVCRSKKEENMIELSCGHKVPAENDYGGEALCPWCMCERTVVEAK